jgi:hypothetical protein
MIDTTSERVIPLKQAVAEVRRLRGDRSRVHLATLYRWTQAGCRGITLEYIQIGSTRCTSAEALIRFFRKLTARADRRSGPPATESEGAGESRSPAGRRQAEEVGRALDDLGI